MQTFSYKAFNRDGRADHGRIDAADIHDAQQALKARGLFVTDVKTIPLNVPAERKALNLSLGTALNQTRFFANLAVLMNAGLGIDQALRAVLDVAERPSDRTLIKVMVDRLASGGTPSDALLLLKRLPEDALALIASGERSGRLAQVVQVVADDLERRESQRKQLIEALVYPGFLLVMMFAAIGVVTFVLVPSLEPIFESSGRDLPFIIGLMSSLRRVLLDPLILLIGFSAAAVVAALAVLQREMFKATINLGLYHLPVLGPALTASAFSRYLQSLSLLLQNAVPLPEALALSARCCTAVAFRQKLLTLREVVVSGRRLPEAFAGSNLFPKSVISLVSVGDEVNKLPVVIESAAGILKDEAQRSLTRMLALLTPTVTIVLGILIGGLVVSVMTALLGINELSLQ